MIYITNNMFYNTFQSSNARLEVIAFNWTENVVIHSLTKYVYENTYSKLAGLSW